MFTAVNVNGLPFDFQRWRSWLNQKSQDLSSEGYKTRFGISDEFNKPKTHLAVVSASTGGYFTNWASGETDFEVLDLKSGERLIERMGLIVADAAFENVFQGFRKHLRL